MYGLKRAALGLAFFAAFMPLGAARAEATDPAGKQIENFYAVLVDGMKQSSGVQARYQKLEPVVKAVFNLDGMTQLIAGPSWAMMSPADQKALTDAFGRMTIADYAANFKKYNGQVFAVDPKVVVRGADRLVTTTLTNPGEKPIAFNYRMREANGAWKVIDIFLAGTVSELATKRSEYASTLASGGAPALVKKLNDLADSDLK